jgi:hypothetical protein
MRSIHLLLVPPAFMLLGCSEPLTIPLEPDALQRSEAPHVSTDVTKLLLPALHYSAVEVGTDVRFSFALPLSGLYQQVHNPGGHSHDPESFQFKHLGDHHSGWIHGAGRIHSMPQQAVGAPFIVFGEGTISVPVTGTRTEDGQTSTVTGTLIIVLEEDVLASKSGSQYFSPCGSACVRFQLGATFFPAGAVGPSCIVAGDLTAADPQQGDPI